MITVTILQVSIASSGNADALGGTGHTIIIGGVDNNFDSISEVINLSGTTQKLSVGNFQKIYFCSILSVGSNKKAVGDIYFNAQNNSNQHGMIVANISGIFSGRCTRPRNYTGYLDTLVSSNAANDNGELGILMYLEQSPYNKKVVLFYTMTF